MFHVCGHMCVEVHVDVVFVCRADVDASCLPQLLFTLFIEAQSLT